MNKEEMTVNEAAEYLNMHYSEVIILVRNFAIPSTRFGNQYKIKKTELDEWKKNKETQMIAN